MKTIKELLTYTPERVTYDLTEISSSMKCHFEEPEIPSISNDLWSIKDKNTKIKIHVLKDFNFDGRRGWMLSIVYFEDKPFMITQNAGREYDDIFNKFIIDNELYKESIRYLKTILPEDIETYPEIDLNSEEVFNKITTFYDNSLFGYFERYRY